MMTLTIPEATPLTKIRAAGSDEPLIGSTIYTVEGQTGLFRRTKRDKRTGHQPVKEGGVVAHVGDELIELVPWISGLVLAEDSAAGEDST